jgi:hypothetical protein
MRDEGGIRGLEVHLRGTVTPQALGETAKIAEEGKLTTPKFCVR